jgi:hypothetical protein
MNVPFAKADLSSHVLQTCPYTLLLLSLEAIERVCSQERSEKSSASCDERASRNEKKGTKQPGTEASARVPKKACAEKHCDICKKHGGMYTMHNTRDCHWFEKDRTEKSDFCAAKKGGKKPTPTKQSSVQLSKKMDNLEKVIKKKDTKKQKHCSSNSDSDSEKGIGLVSIGKTVINLGKTCKKTKFTPPSPIKATLKDVTSDKKDIRLTSVSDGDDIMVTSSTQNEGDTGKLQYSH